MTLTHDEAEALFRDLDALARRAGTLGANREQFDTMIAFAAVNDPDALEALRKVYNVVVKDLLRQRKGGKRCESYN